MTKKWLSLVLVLTLLASLFSGAAMAEAVEKGMDPVITFVSAMEAKTDVTGKTSLPEQVVGTFYVDGAVANAEQTTAIKTIVKGVSYSVPDALGTTTWRMANGKLYAKMDFTDSKFISSNGATMSLELTSATPTLAGYDLEKLGDKVSPFLAISVLTIYEPIASVALASSNEASDAQSASKTTAVKGKIANAVKLTATAAGNPGKTPATPTYAWESSNDKVATLSTKTGDETVVSTVGSGIATITVTATNDKGSKTDTWKIVVNERNVEKLTITTVPAATDVTKIPSDTTVQLKATGDAKAT
ncbi:MAG: hypothetical protein RR150_12065, partial [Clostridia bacterium]